MPENIVKLQNWSVVKYRHDWNGYSAPETWPSGIYLQGHAYGHPRFEDGGGIVTGTIQATAGRVVSSKRTTYRLGRVCRKYRAWLKEQDLPYDAKCPVKLGKS